VHNVAKERDLDLAPGLLTNDADAVVTDPAIDVVVEVIGGVEPARRLILTALKSGKPVVTANKELLANVIGSSHMAPSGIVAVGHAQEHGYAYAYCG